MNYKIVSVEDEPSASEAVTALENIVKDCLQEGWNVQGGVALTYSSVEESYAAAQAMVKE